LQIQLPKLILTCLTGDPGTSGPPVFINLYGTCLFQSIAVNFLKIQKNFFVPQGYPNDKPYGFRE
jgi:hypothetical protein